MAITLELITSPQTTPIVANAAGTQPFVNDYYKAAQGSLSAQQRKAIIIVALTHAVTGIDYRTAHAALIQDAEVWTRGLSNFDFFTAMTGPFWTYGKSVDAATSADIPTLLNEGRDFANLAEQDQDKIITLLLTKSIA